MPTQDPAQLCAVCSDPIDPDEDLHDIHDDDCPRSQRHTTADEVICACDLVAHPDRCPLCQEPES